MKLSLAWVPSIRFGLLRCAVVGLIGASVVAGCTATGTDGTPSGDVDPPDDDAGGGIILPPSNSGEDSSVPDADAGKKDSGGKVDAGKDAGPPAPTPGAVCTSPDTITSRQCGKCGKQETICQAGDAGALAWTEYGPCAGELGACLPGTTQACGNCGTQTCTSFCGWGACTGQPAGHCSPGTVQNTTAGCPTSGFRSRTCAATCQWQQYTSTCDAPTAVDLYAGPAGHSTFMRSSDGKLYGWGLNADGQLGDGTLVNKSKIVPLPMTGVVSLQVGGGSGYGLTCAVLASGGAKCWGDISTSYTLGDGVTSVSATGIVPTGFGADVLTMGAGYGHGCGLFADGTAKCWGYNIYGAHGNGTTTTSTTPVAVGLTDISQLYVGYYNNCARKGDAAYCWGYNTYGQVGDGTITSPKSSPVLVIPSGVASLAPSYYHTCAVMTDGTAKCWGDNGTGGVGVGTTVAKIMSPSDVVGIDGVGANLSGVAEVCTGYGHSCARLTDGRVACWGYNTSGQVGIGTTTNSTVPRVVSGVTAASKLVCGYYHSCVIDAGGRVKCWGDNAYGQVGNGGMPTDSTTAQIATF
jgi:alpha-tubulin suppressor-like RCC1 family protein